MTYKKFIGAIATGAIVLNSMASVAYAESITVTGNGAYSQNGAQVTDNQKTSVTQTNNAEITNKVSSNASTGGNSSNFNTGGDTVIKTGDATNKVDVSNKVNKNNAVVETCGGCDSAADVKVKDNGAFSKNQAEVTSNKETALTQDNNAKIKNYIDAEAKTGGNNAGFNTNGDSVIVTGDAKTVVSVENDANKNVAKFGGSEGAGNGSHVEILGNGAFSINGVALTDNSAVVLAQDNEAYIVNKVDADAKTGGNEGNFNTGGETYIVTGNAKAKAAVENAVNFNYASVDCDCLLEDLNVKIGSNGADSFNAVEAEDNNVLEVAADNNADYYNKVESDAKTGYNESGYGAGHESDSSIITGDSKSDSEVSNTGNVNTFNQGAALDLPGDVDVDFDFDFSGLFGFLYGFGLI